MPLEPIQDQPKELRGVCDACHYENTPLKEYGPAFGPQFEKYGRRQRFCDVCSATFISFTETDPEKLMNPMYFYRSIARIANMILDELSEMRFGRRR